MPSLEPMPDLEGPKLGPFTDDLLSHDVEFLDLLNGGVHSLVYKTKIDGKLYALKIVRILFPPTV